jgi:hypothetical protein
VTNKLTPAHADEFENYIRKWQALLNLHDWRIERSARPAGKGTMADVHTSFEDRLAVYRLGRDFGPAEVTAHSLESTAAHELLHVLLKDLIHATGKDRMAAEHRVVHTLERLLVPPRSQ